MLLTQLYDFIMFYNIPDCPGGYVCDKNNFCVAKPCLNQKDCKSNQRCVDRQCQPIECR